MSLEKLIRPKSIAIVGVTDKLGFGRSAALSIVKSKDTDRVYYVNPKREELFGRKCYKTIQEVPEIVDCIVVCTPRNVVPSVLKDSAELGTKAAVVYASGFAEEGTEEGTDLENQLIEISNTYDMKILGPNCMGLLNCIDKVNLWAGGSKWDLDTKKPGIGIVGQSGFITAEIVSSDYFNISYGFSTGNGNIVTLEDAVDFLVDDNYASVIAIYLEGLKNPQKFIDALKRAAQKRKPVIILKSGRSEKGAISAASHTGNLAGSSKAFESIFEKYGVISVENLEQFMCLAQAFSVLDGNLPTNSNFAAINFSGGENTICADLAEENGVELAEISTETKEEMKKYLPGFATPKNPLDATTALFHEKDMIVGLLHTFEKDSSVGFTMVGANIRDEENEMHETLCQAVSEAREQGLKKPVFAVPTLEGNRYLDYRTRLEDNQVPIMSSVGTTFTCFNKMAKFIDYDYLKRTLEFKAVKKRESNNVVALSELDSKIEMKKYGVPVPGQGNAKSIDELDEILKYIKYPVVLKINSSEILHKSDVGGVKIGIKNRDEAVDAYNEILTNVKKAKPDANIDGILVQEMVESGIEIIIGITNDDQFGPMLLVGLGGVFVEVFKDTTLYPLPINHDEAIMMLKKLKSFKLLNGYRGSEPCDIDALADMMVKLGKYAYENKDEVKEIDLNPVFVYPKGKGVCAVDALIVKYK